MTTALLLLLVSLSIGYMGVSAVLPHRSKYSDFERRRRQKLGENLEKDIARHEQASHIMFLRTVISRFVLVIVAMIAAMAFGWGGAILWVLFVIVIQKKISAMTHLDRFSQRIYDEREQSILTFVHSYEPIFRWLNPSRRRVSARPLYTSADELLYVIRADSHILNERQRQSLIRAFEFSELTVRDGMTQLKDVVSIKKSDILGPMVLNDLHSSGHTLFPVTESDQPDTVIGILRLRDVQTLDTRRENTATVESAMDTEVIRVAPEVPLSQALKQLTDKQVSMAVVSDQTQQTIGIITLKSIVNRLVAT